MMRLAGLLQGGTIPLSRFEDKPCVSPLLDSDCNVK